MKKKKIIIVILLTISILVLNTVYVQASTIDDMITAAKKFINIGDQTEYKISTATWKTLSDTIYNILFTIGVIVAVAVAAILGIKYMVGSASEQSQIKETIIPFIVGCIVVFGSFGIWKLVVTIAQSTGL